jgi:hypothetical protein
VVALFRQPRSLILPRGLKKPARPVLDPTHPLSRGLIGCWLLGDSTFVAQDIGPNGVNGIVQGPFLFAPSHHGGQALDFDGIGNRYVSLGINPVLKPPLPISISLWLWKSAGYQPTGNDGWFNNDNLFGTGTYSGTGMADSGTGAAELDFGDGAGGASTHRRSKAGTTILSLQTWYHVLGVIRGATDMSIYINGVDDGGSYSGSGGSLAYTGQTARIGNFGAHSFSGILDGVRLYNRDLNQSEAQWLYAEPYAGIYEAQSAWRVGAVAAPPANVELWSGSCM